MVYARKHKPVTMPDQVYLTLAPSHTKGRMVELIVSPEYLANGEKVLIIDDSSPLLFNKATQKLIDSKHGHLVLKYSDFFYPKLKKFLGKDFKPRVIGGLITPVTGKRFTKTWLADTLLPCAASFYKMLQVTQITTETCVVFFENFSLPAGIIQ